MVKFFYNYYYVLFLHHQAIKKKRPDNNPWIMALLMLTVSIGVPLLVICSAVWYHGYGPSRENLDKKLFALLVMAILYYGLYWLLFKHINVSKQDGTTDHYPVPHVDRRKKMLYIILWALSLILPIVIAAVVTPEPLKWA